MATNFPKEMARGLKHEEWVNDKPPFVSAFFFDKETRADGKRELSVVDLSYNNALEHLKLQKYRSSGKMLFPAGFAILTREKIDKIIAHRKYPLEYEHKPSPNNEAHGNILIGKMAAYEERKVAECLAMYADIHPIDDDYP